ncbi:MAG: CDP-alcohol phosphatidyltransferase family protein [Muribaculaceae bacterium]|nr:CDP-alcohol phosphatidyltransferase family protein [Muribaculaceae bacterium]
MEIKKVFKENRDSLQLFIYKVIDPLVHALVKVGFTPNMVTTIGFLGNVAAAALFIMGGIHGHSAPIGYEWLLWGGMVLIVFSLFDMLDGQVARIGGMASTFGAMYDSVLDRYSEMVTLGGICYLMMQTGYEIGALITFVALVGSIMVSYVRARAEGLDIECKIGFMQRPERVVLTALSALATGIYGVADPTPAFSPMLILIVAMGIIAVFANLTAFARIYHSRRELERKEGKR